MDRGMRRTRIILTETRDGPQWRLRQQPEGQHDERLEGRKSRAGCKCIDLL
jgi:hypothetical protein